MIPKTLGFGTHYRNTVGGLSGHILRRIVHLFMLVLPFLYYAYANTVASVIKLSSKQLLLLVLGITLILEIIRLCFGFILFGQRSIERKKLSSMASGICGICLVLLLAPRFLAIPIIASCAIVDPLLGELRQTRLPSVWTWIIGMAGVALIWGLASRWYSTPHWLLLVMAPWTVLLERPNFRWIDDNLMMLLGPLLLWMVI
jgi:hypothetical protein